ncbi:MAG: hypothetical protein R2778_10130 [Saprospiraceae bacterium]
MATEYKAMEKYSTFTLPSCRLKHPENTADEHAEHLPVLQGKTVIGEFLA